MTEQSTDSELAERPTAGRAWLIGNVLIAGGVVWLIIDRVLALRYPLRWGGPNIGGGALVLLAFLAVAAGAVTVVTVVVGRVAARRASPPHLRGRGAAGSGPSARRSWVAPVMVSVLLVAALLSVIVRPGLVRPGGDEPAGAVGLTVTESGSPILLLEVCRGSVDTVTVVGPNRGSQPNEQLARLTSQAAVTAPTSVDVVRPNGRWTGSSLPGSTPALLIATASGPRGSLRQVSFTATDLASLDPATVLFSAAGPTGDTVTRRAPIRSFSRLACAGTSTLSHQFAHPITNQVPTGSVPKNPDNRKARLSNRAAWGVPGISDKSLPLRAWA